MPQDLKSLLKLMVEKNASDLHISVNTPLHLRVDDELVPIDNAPIKAEAAKQLIYSMLSKELIDEFEKELELDFSFEVEGLSRFRVNVFKQRSNLGCAIRVIPFKIMTFEECGLPTAIVKDLCSKQKGLVLVTGATGSGKSTSLASMVDYINANRACHIVTIEDPIEFVHSNKKSLIDQREVYTDTHSFASSLKHVLRQDPDVILIGEMRDIETIESALIIAETGHLVFATLHTSDSVQTINRIIDVFPAYQQEQVKVQLSFVLLAVLSQQLIPKAGARGRALATEVLVATPAVRSLIREGKTHQIYSIIQTSQKDGMKTMNQSLLEIVAKGIISNDAALARSFDTDEFRALSKR